MAEEIKYIASGSYNQIQGGGIVVNTDIPLDVRAVVDRKSDLTDIDKWSMTKPYVGILVAVLEDRKVYMLANYTHSDVPEEKRNITDIFTKEENWQCISSTQAAISATSIKEAYGYITIDDTNVPVIKNGEKYYTITNSTDELDESDIIVSTDESPIYYDESTLDVIITINEDGNEVQKIGDTVIHTISGEGTYIKTSENDGTISYSKIDLTSIYNYINETKAELLEEIDALNKSFIFRGSAKYADVKGADEEETQEETQTEEGEEPIEDKTPDFEREFTDFADSPIIPDTPFDITNLRAGDVFQTPDSKEWALAVEEDEDGNETYHWVELGFNIDNTAYIKEIKVNSEQPNFLDISISHENQVSTIDVSIAIAKLAVDATYLDGSTGEEVANVSTGFVTDAQLRTMFGWIILDGVESALTPDPEQTEPLQSEPDDEPTPTVEPTEE